MSSFKNTRLQTYLSDEIKEKLAQIADESNVSMSQLIAHILVDYLNKKKNFILLSPDREQTKKVTKILLTANEKSALELVAKSHGHSINREIIFMIRSCLSAKETLTQEEITQLKVVKNELSSVGRNLNAIARSTKDNEQISVLKDEMNALAITLEKQEKNIRKLIAKTEDRWLIIEK